MIRQHIEEEAQREARRILAGRDPEARDWRAAGYITARQAAEALVGDLDRGPVWDRTVELVTAAIAKE